MSAFRVWNVTGEKQLPNGHTAALFATSFGATEERARQFFQRLQERAPKADVFGEPYTQWADQDLVFTPEPAEGGAR